MSAAKSTPTTGSATATGPKASPATVPIVAYAPPPISAAQLAQEYPSNLKLTLVQYVHRHGERTPVWPGLQHMVPPVHNDCHLGSFLALDASTRSGPPQLYRKSLLNAATWAPGLPDEHIHNSPAAGACYHGQLTDRGRNTLTGLGSYLRDVYISKLKLVPETLSDPSQVFLRSTDYARTLESLHSLMNGLFPPHARSLPADQALHIYTRSPAGHDNIYPDHECARYLGLRKQFTALIKNDVKKDMQQWPQKLQEMWDDKYGPVLAFDVLASAISHNWSVDISPNDFERLRDASTRLWFQHMENYPLLPKMMMGRFLTELYELQHHVITGSPSKQGHPEFTMHLQHMAETKAKAPPKLAVYSGHDTTIAPLVGVLGLWTGKNRMWPLFASHVTVETFKDLDAAKSVSDPKDAHYVRVRYNDVAQQLPACALPEQHHPNDKSLCTFRAFEALIKEVGTTRKQHQDLCVPVTVQE
ncbi:histidine phosphatase superfamily [Catenaria anguillulae PL171]|uniref:Histidine phosphatase superfamily n=1 Tax=Catenaria anguillulae PL171 TaxID=765915 RepID=A0A1Y2HJP9_9FUNG|nr:histidine phosphatase superfamily [Catenaria anguillulae PL171]